MTQLADLARPFPRAFVQTNPSGGGSYVSHSEVTQWLLMVVGPFSFEVVELIRGYVDAKPPNPKGTSAKAKAGSPALDGAVVGCLGRLSCTVDGKAVTVVEVGDCESPHNWAHDGARAKDAASDSIKRCAMRLSVGLHLWAQDNYFLRRKLTEGDAVCSCGHPFSDHQGSADPNTGDVAFCCVHENNGDVCGCDDFGVTDAGA